MRRHDQIGRGLRYDMEEKAKSGELGCGSASCRMQVFRALGVHVWGPLRASGLVQHPKLGTSLPAGSCVCPEALTPTQLI